MRLSSYLNLLLILIIISSLYIIITLFKNDSETFRADYNIERSIVDKHVQIPHHKNEKTFKKIECQLPIGHNSFKCLSADGKKIYVPFDFVSKKFDVSYYLYNIYFHIINNITFF